MKKPEEICECGHKKREHRDATQRIMADACYHKGCDCQFFKPSKKFKAKNHSPQNKGCRKMFSRKGKWKSDRLIVGKCGDAIGLCPKCIGDFPIETKITTKALKRYYDRVKNKEGTFNLGKKIWNKKRVPFALVPGEEMIYLKELKSLLKKAIRKLKEKAIFIKELKKEGAFVRWKEIDKIFGKELSK